jgi:hypothetical protein
MKILWYYHKVFLHSVILSLRTTTFQKYSNTYNFNIFKCYVKRLLSTTTVPSSRETAPPSTIAAILYTKTAQRQHEQVKSHFQAKNTTACQQKSLYTVICRNNFAFCVALRPHLVQKQFHCFMNSFKIFYDLSFD